MKISGTIKNHWKLGLGTYLYMQPILLKTTRHLTLGFFSSAFCRKIHHPLAPKRSPNSTVMKHLGNFFSTYDSTDKLTNDPLPPLQSFLPSTFTSKTCWCLLIWYPPEDQHSPWKVTFPTGKSSSNHHFSGATLNFGMANHSIVDYILFWKSLYLSMHWSFESVISCDPNHPEDGFNCLLPVLAPATTIALKDWKQFSQDNSHQQKLSQRVRS